MHCALRWRMKYAGKAVDSRPRCPTITPLKRGVNETGLSSEEICPAPELPSEDIEQMVLLKN